MKLCLVALWPPRWLRERRELRGVPKMNEFWIQQLTENGRYARFMEERAKARQEAEDRQMEWDED